MGANGALRFKTAREAASYAQWAAKIKGGVINVYDAEGKLFKIIEVAPDLESEDGLILPSV